MLYPCCKKHKLTSINIHDDKIKPIVKKIIENTFYISFEYFYSFLIKNFKEIIKDKNDFSYIYVYISNNNSIKYWIKELLENFIKHQCYNHISIKVISSLQMKTLNTNDIILIVNDCCMEEKEEEITIIKEMNNEYLVKLNIYLFIPFISFSSLSKVINEFNNNKTLFNYTSFHLCPYISFLNKTINFYLKKKEIYDLEYYYKNKYNFNDINLIYFDHCYYNNLYSCFN